MLNKDYVMINALKKSIWKKIELFSLHILMFFEIQSKIIMIWTFENMTHFKSFK
jgi:hypothetical protein